MAIIQSDHGKGEWIMAKNTGAAKVAVVMLMVTLTGCGKITGYKEYEVLQGAAGDSVYANYEQLSYKEKIEDNGYRKFIFDYSSECFKDSEENILISPASVFFVMEMFGAGARGETLDEINSVLVPNTSNEEALAFAVDYYNSMISEDPDVFKSVNCACINDDFDGGFYQEYLDFAGEKMGAEIMVAPFNFVTVNNINNWASNKTDKMITKVIDELDSREDVCVLVNAMSFNARWEREYDDDAILKKQIFTNSKGKKEKVTMLYSKEDSLIYTDKAIGFMKSYEGCKYAFLALLPTDETLSGNEFLSLFSYDDYIDVLEHNSYFPSEVYIPEFSYDYSNEEIVSIMRELGIDKAFNEGGADFGNMTDEDIFISNIVQMTHIEVDREGTKAAVVTEGRAVSRGAEPDPVEIRLDRPFAYMIVDTETMTPIFIGSVNSIG